MKQLLLSSFLVLFACFAMAQSKTITGRVTDGETGETLPGVTIAIKGTTSGSITDFDGNFSLSVSDDQTLVVSYIGYKSQEIPVGSQTTINISLSADVSELSEVVIIGYGETTIRDATGSVAAVSSEDFNGGVISSPEQLIQGKTAGVQISSNTGAPGGGVQLRIRGANSARSNNNPLFVVDGVPLVQGDISAGGADLGFGSNGASNPLSFLNPSDIESISILKDASASAIYGSRGANGVVFITTKSGRGGRSIEYSSSVSISTPPTYDLLSGQAFLDGVASKGGDPTAANLGSNTDWQDVVFRDAISNNHNVSYSQGFKTGSIRASFGYDNQQGVVENSRLRRATGRINGNKTFLNEKLNVQLSLTYSDVFEESPAIGSAAGFRGDLIGATYSANPTWPNDPTFNPGDLINPANLLDSYNSESETQKLLTNISVDYALTDNLKAKVTYGLDYSDSDRMTLLNGDAVAMARGTNGNGRSANDIIENTNNLFEATLNYNKTFGSAKLDVVAGYSFQDFSREGWNAQGYGFSTTEFGGMASAFRDALSVLDGIGTNAEGGGWYQNVGYSPSNSYVSVLLPSPNQTTITAPTGLDVGSAFINRFNFNDQLQSYFGRANLTLNNKFIATATVRADGSSRFSDDNRYGVFPSLAVAWILSEEDFIPATFSTLKMRLGWGINGNQEGLGYGNFLARQRYGQPEIFDNGNQNLPGLGTVSLETPSLKWEETSQTSFGIDFGVSNERLTGSIDFYRKETSDLILRLIAAQPAANAFVFGNFDGKIINDGFELTLNYDVVQGSDFTFDASFNIARNNNEIQDFDGIVDVGTVRGQGLSFAFAQRFASGQPLFAWFVRDFSGFDSAGQPIIDDNQRFTGTSALPVWSGGLSLNFKYKRFDLSTYLAGQFGHEVYNNTANAFYTAGALRNGRNTITDVASSPEDALAEPSVSTRFLEKGDFVRLQNLTLGYNFDMPDNSVIKNLRVFFNSQNLFLITGYSGLDPEVSSIPGTQANGSSDLLNGLPTAGIDFAAYPRPKVFTLGVNATF